MIGEFNMARKHFFESDEGYEKSAGREFLEKESGIKKDLLSQ